MKILDKCINKLSSFFSSAFSISKLLDTNDNDKSLEQNRNKINYLKKRYEQKIKLLMNLILDFSDFYEESNFNQNTYNNVMDQLRAVYSEVLNQNKNLEELASQISQQEREEINNKSIPLINNDVYEQIRQEEQKINDILQKINHASQLTQCVQASISKKIKKSIFKKDLVSKKQLTFTKKCSLQGA